MHSGGRSTMWAWSSQRTSPGLTSPPNLGDQSSRVAPGKVTRAGESLEVRGEDGHGAPAPVMRSPIRTPQPTPPGGGGGEGDLSAQADVAGPNAHMQVQARSALSGELLKAWTGEAYFRGELPTSYLALRGPKGWRWTRDAAPAPEAARLKIDSDERGDTGMTVAQWAPAAATVLTVDLVPLSQPLVSSSSSLSSSPPSGVSVPFTAREADGAAEPRGVATLEGPQTPGTVRQQGDLQLLDEAHSSTLSLGESSLRLHGKPGEYLYRLPPQTSPRQRVVQIQATDAVVVEDQSAAAGAVELVPHVQRTTREELDALRGGGDLFHLKAPQISASGDAWRVALRLGKSALHVTALSAEARFAYYVDPDWSGARRVVHVVATPGVRIEARPNDLPALHDDDPRVLVPNPIYVQDPRLVPAQGQPIDPSRYLGISRHDHMPTGVTATPANRAAFTVARGSTGITVRDLESGAALTIRADDPTLGARILHEVEGRQVRALVSRSAHVEIVQARQAPRVMGEAVDPAFDFGQVDFQIYQLDREDRFPDPGTPLTKEALEAFGHPKPPDAVEWVTAPEKARGQQAVEGALDLGLSFVPGADVVLDASDAAAALTLGTDKWGNPLSRGEKVAVLVAFLLPFLSAGAVLTAGRVLSEARTLRAATALRSVSALAERMGRSDTEVEALLAGLRRLDDEGRAAARRAERAIALGDPVDVADLRVLENALSQAGFRGVSLVGAPRAGVAAMGSAAAPIERATKLAPTAGLVEVEQRLQRALDRHARALGMRGGARRAPVEVLPKAAFVERFASEQARAAFQLTDRGPVIFARADATAADMLDEAAHLAQLGDASIAPSIRMLDEANLADWASLSVADQLELFQRKLEVELDAKRRTLAVVRSQADRALTQSALDDLERLQAQVAAIEPDELAKMCSGRLPAPEYLAQAPRLFGKQRRVREDVPSLHTRGVGAEPAPRLVSNTRGSADFSSAYSTGDVVSVHQLGHSWRESTIVTADLDGVIASRTLRGDGTMEIVIRNGRQVRTQLLEAGAEMDARVIPGRKIKTGDLLGRETSREYRRVEVMYADGRKQERTEIRSFGEGRSWVQRGLESTTRGRLAEKAARAEVDAEMLARLAKKEITTWCRIPSARGSGGFDDVIVEFTGEGEALQAKIRIREVKDHPNRHLALADFSALMENFEENYGRLRVVVNDELKLAKGGQARTGPLAALSTAQLSALRRSLRRSDHEVELVLGPSTRLGAPGHHASHVVPALQKQHPTLKILRLKESS
jgi:hypothetical protein